MENNTAKNILGVDCWDVIFSVPTASPVAGAFDALRAINNSGKFQKIYIVSKVDPLSEQFSKINFLLKGFSKYTGIPRENIFFCRKYEDKAPICDKLGITHFVDDRLIVLSYMNNVKNLYALSPRKKEVPKYPETVKKITIVKTWEELLPLLLR